MKSQSLLLLALAVAVAGCGGGSGHPETTDGLKTLMTNLSQGGDAAEAEAKTLMLEDDGAPWFKKVYGDDTGETLAAEYARSTGSGPAGLIKMLRDSVAKGRTEFIVEKFSDAKDPNAVGFQQTALEMAKKPIVLYSFRAVPPGKKSGQHVYNFIYLDGQWKFAGPMKSLKPEMANDEKMNAVSSLRAKDREKFFETGELPD